MDNTGTKKSKNNAKATRRFWNKREEDFLIGAMKDVFLSDLKWKRDNNQFRLGFYNLCEKKILLAFAGTDLLASPHIESKIKLWRKQYSTLYDMVNASGFGWDDCEKMVLVDSDDVWSNYVKRVLDAKGTRNKPFPYYEDWLILFGKDRATGELAEGPAESVAAMENEETIGGKGDESPVEQFWFNEIDIDYSMSYSGNTTNPADSSKPPDSSKVGKKRVRPAAGISQGLSKMAVTVGAFFENTNSRMAEIAHRIGYSHDLSQQRRLVNIELLKLPMSTGQKLKVASMIVKDEKGVDLFFSLEEDDKMEWVCMLLEGSII